MINEKKVSKSGSITIPSHLRRKMGLVAGEKVKIEQDKEGNFAIRRIEGSCIYCKTNDDLMKIQGLYICDNCAKIVRKSYEERHKED